MHTFNWLALAVCIVSLGFGVVNLMQTGKLSVRPANRYCIGAAAICFGLSMGMLSLSSTITWAIPVALALGGITLVCLIGIVVLKTED